MRVEGYPPAVQPRLVIPMIFVVLAIWLAGAWATKYSLEEMAVFTPIAVVAIGAFAGIILLWVKIVRDSLRGRGRSEP
jgi:RsiW-degrading membrane proteinase PrsW (M82 family)